MHVHHLVQGARTRLVPSGELDLATAPVLRDAALRAAREHEEVLLDLSELDFMDLSGLRVLYELRETAARDGMTIRLVPCDLVIDLLATLRLEPPLPLSG